MTTTAQWSQTIFKIQTGTDSYNMKKQLLCLLWCLSALSISSSMQAQSIDREVENRLNRYLQEYQLPHTPIGKCKLDSFHIDHNRRQLTVYPNPTFGYQLFTTEKVRSIYNELKEILPGPINYYRTKVIADNKPIDKLVPNAWLSKGDKDDSKLWKGTANDEMTAWTKNVARPYEITKGLNNRHLAIWQSHGSHYRHQTDTWRWQRPRLFCTTEDLFTQSFVVPFIIPMLENAGAVVFTPRERDTQTNEVIVDNDASTTGSIYYEERSKKSPWKTSPLKGFAHYRTTYTDGEAPFITGTARFAPTAGRKKKTQTLATWIPDIPETGSYAVYVSYHTLPHSIPDAHYTVFHKGGATEFIVNQQMGGGTWVYLGTFEFDKGQNDYGFVALDNKSDHQGVVTADAVRFGGGMGNIEREGQISGLPRYLEGARYWSHWSGLSYELYSGRKSTNDYADDINVRSHMTNHLSGGSAYNPHQKGLRVPIEMTLGVHSDAGFSKEDEYIGSLGIYTTDFNDGLLGAGISRYASRDLNTIILDGLQRDLTEHLGRPWIIRGMWNRNYSESRLPMVPSMILETLSHQNFADLKLGHDPNFKFALGRSVYKSILRYVATQHQQPYTVQPLPVNNFAIRFVNQPEPLKKRKKKMENATIELSWKPVTDKLEPTAKPTSYILYTRIGYGGFDNGTAVKGTSCQVSIEPGLVYSFKVTAANSGGESFPSEILSAYQAPESNTTLLLVNGFDRLSGPATIENPVEQGFDLRRDAGIPYLYSTSFCGMQQYFDRTKIGIETEGGLGFSGSELEGMKIAGNTFDYPFIHGKAIQAVGGYSFVSCSDEAVENGHVRLSDYPMVDYILGMEKTGGCSAMNGEVYQTFSPVMQQLLSTYLRRGGRLLASGGYLTSDPSATTDTDGRFTNGILKYRAGGSLAAPPTAGSLGTLSTSQVRGSNISFTIPRTLNPNYLAIATPEIIMPESSAFTPLLYDEGGYSAAIAYAGTDYRTFILGFPLESVIEEQQRFRLMSMVLQFLLPKSKP